MAKAARKKDAKIGWRCPRMALSMSNPDYCEKRQAEARKEFKARRGVWMVAELNACKECSGPEAIK